MDNIPSANMRQHKLDQQRKLIEEKQKQKRAMQNKKIELNDLKAGGGKSRPGSSNKRELHGYDGPLQYLSHGNPDSMTTVQVSRNTPNLNKQISKIWILKSFYKVVMKEILI